MSGAIHLCVRGTAAGEHALAARFAAAARARGHEVVAWVDAVPGGALVEGSGAELRRLLPPVGLRRHLVGERAAALVAATSLTTAEHHREAADFGGTICTLDSSWLYWTRDMVPHSHIDRFLVALPPEVFTAGAVDSPRSAPGSVLGRVTPVGWLAGSVAREVPRDDHVAIYFGRGYAPRERPWIPALAEAIEQVARVRPALSWQFCGPTEVAWPACVERGPHWMSDADFESFVGSARLLVCHHGQVVIGLAAAAGVRVLAFSEGAIFRGSPHDLGDRELHAFEAAGIADAIHGVPPAERIAARILAQHDGPARAGVGNVDGAEGAVRVVESIIEGGGRGRS